LSVARSDPPSWRRQRNIALIIKVAIPLAILLIALLVGIWAYDDYVAVWNQRIVRVNEKTIDMDNYVKMLRYHLITAETNITTEEEKTEYGYSVLTKIEDYEVLRQRASKLGVVLSPDEITDFIENNMISANYGDANISEVDIDVDDLYKRYLDFIQLSDSEYRELATVDLLGEKVYSYFDENEVPVEGEHVYLHAILVTDELIAHEIYSELKDGGNFTAQAVKYSVYEDLTGLKGEIGWIPRGGFPEEVDEVAFSIEVGNVSDPIATSQGYYIIKISDKDENRELDEKYRQFLANTLFEEWFQKEKESSIIVEYIDKDKLDFAFDQI